MEKTKEHLLKVEENNEEILLNLNENIDKIKSRYNHSSDVVYRFFSIGEQKACLVYIGGLTDETEVSENVLQQLMAVKEVITSIDHLIEKNISVAEVQQVKTFSELLNNLSGGFEILLVDQISNGVAIGLPK